MRKYPIIDICFRRQIVHLVGHCLEIGCAMLGNVYLICVLVGGTLFLCQFLLSLFAMGGGHGGGGHRAPGGRAAPAHGLAQGAGHGALNAGHAGAHAPAHAAAIQTAAAGGHRGFLSRGGGRHAGPRAARGSAIGSWLQGMLTVQGIVAGITLFGLAGMASLTRGWLPWVSVLLALIGAAGGMFIVAGCLRIMVSMDSDGAVQIEDCVGQSGRVYLSVPPRQTGLGKVFVNVRERTMEYPAVTYQEKPLEPPDAIVVVGVQPPGTLEVVSASSVPTQVEL